MSTRRIALAPLLAGALAASASSTAFAGVFEVTPTTVGLSPLTGAGLVRIANRGDRPVSIRVQPYDWRQSADRDALTPSATLAASPPIARLAPGDVQIVQLRERSPASGAAEQAHRLLVTETAPDGGAAAGQVRVLLQFSLPVFRPPQTPGAARLSWDALMTGGMLVLTTVNAGPRHAKLAHLAAARGAGEGAAAIDPLVYVLSGASRTWRIPGDGFARGDVVLTAEDGLTGRPLAWNLKVRRRDETRAAP